MLGFSLLVPAFLFGLLTIAVPIALHLIKRETAPTVSFSAVRLLRRTPIERTSRRSLSDWLLLILRVVALVLLVLGYARPYSTDAVGADSRPLLVVAVDISFSMTVDGQFNRALRLAEEALRGAPDDHAVAVTAFDTVAQVIAEPSFDRQSAVAKLRQLIPGAGATSYSAGLDHAAKLIGQRAGGITVISDLQFTGWRESNRARLPEKVDIRVVDIGAPLDNMALIQIRPEPTRTVAMILNSGVEVQNTSVRLLLDEQEIAQSEIIAPAGQTVEVVFPVVLPKSGEVQVVLNDPLGVAIDNSRYMLLKSPEPKSLLVVTTGENLNTDAFYLEQALGVGREQTGFQVVLIPGTNIAPLIQSTNPNNLAAVLLLTTRGLDQASQLLLAEFVANGGGVLIVAGEDVEPATVNAFLQGTLTLSHSRLTNLERNLIPANRRHTIWRAFGGRLGNLSQVGFSSTMTITLDGQAEVLASFNDGFPALVESKIGDGSVIVFGSDLNNEWNNFPRHPTFVPFVHEIVRYLTAEREMSHDFVVGNVPREVAERPGFATLVASGRRIVINVDSAESDLNRLSMDEFMVAVDRHREAVDSTMGELLSEGHDVHQYWQYIFGLMLAILMTESMLSARTS